jgi:leucyl-tRNA synthetase
VEAFRGWRPEFADASFVLEDGKYVCGWAIEKMSKSYYNVTNPDDIIQRYGADTLRLYEMFLGPIDQSKPWKNDGIEGVHRFLKRFWSLVFKEDGTLNVTAKAPSDDELRIIHPLIKKIREDMTSLSFNTAVSAFMIAQNALMKLDGPVSRQTVEMFLQCLSPFAPHIAEEVWEKLGHKDLLLDATIPEFDERYVVSSKMVLPISLNGKKRVVLELPLGLDEATVKDTVLKDAQVTKALEGKTIKKIIYVEGRMFNIVV